MWTIAGERANKTSFVKLFEPWPLISFPELMVRHQSRGTQVPCWSLWCSAPPSSEPWWTLYLFSPSSLFFKLLQKSVFKVLCHTKHPHTPTVFFLSFKHSLRVDSEKVHKWKLWYRNRYVHMRVYTYCLHKYTHSLLSAYLNNDWYLIICNSLTGISHHSSVSLFW